MLRAVNPVSAILTRLVASQDDPASLPPEQTLKEPSTRPLPVRHQPAKLGTVATTPWNLCTAAPPLCMSPAHCAEVKHLPMPFLPLVSPLTGAQSHAGEPAAAQRRPALLRATPEPPRAP